MAILNRTLFCDESETNSPQFYIGGIECSRRRSEILCERIAEMRRHNNFYHEFKWQKIGNNKKYIGIYKELLDIFITDEFSKMYIIRFNKGEDWKRWSSNEDQRFFKCYYYFLMWALKPFARYEIYADEKSLIKDYYWDSLYWSLTNTFKARDTGYTYDNKKVIEKVEAVDSKAEDLIQLADVLIKSFTATSTGEGRRAIIDHIKSIKSSKIHISDWMFDESKVILRKK